MSDLFAGLHPDDYDRVYRNRELIARIGHRLRPGTRRIALAVVLTVGASILTSAVPVAIARMIDQVRDGSHLTWTISAFVIVAAAAAWAMNWGRQRLIAWLVGDLVLRLQREVAEAALARDASFHDRHSVGKVLSRVTGDTESFSAVMTLTLNFFSQMVLVVVLGSVVFAVDPRLGLILLVVTPLLVGVALLFRRIARVAALRTRQVMAQVNSTVHESMVGILIAKSFGREESLYQDFRRVNRLSYLVYVRQGLIYTVILPVLTMISVLGTAALLVGGGSLAIDGSLSAGDWYFALHALGLLWLPLTQAASFWSLFQQGLAASERVFALIDSEDSVRQTAAEPVADLRGEIEIRDLRFGYGSGAPVFDRLNLRIAAGETVAVVGRTGAGKSTLSKLVLRGYEFQQGALLIDGRDIRRLDLAEYRYRLGVVPQLPFIFAGTLAENIAYARPGADRADVQRAVDQLGEVWARCIPFALDDQMASLGRELSTGQRQLIALARIFLKQPAILLLDEPTASIDPLTEAGIQQALTRLMADRTVLVIAHRLATIRHVDRLLVLDHGRVVEEGDFDTLLAAGGHFTDLYASYYAHQQTGREAEQRQWTRS
ncbi:ABC transporter ATP-binding protein [Micromonospora sediminimaris]|uniref:ABC transporter ATP-binding protein n=1 Tax=Micromonospora sediminimaris TaxID=547162 RepID=UPI003794087F